MRHVRNAVHGDFERNGDLLLDLLGGDAGPLRDDLDVIVRHVGIGFDGKLMERDRAPDEQQQRRRQHQEAVLQREIDELANHCYCSTVFWKTSAFGTTCAPGLRPRDDLLHVVRAACCRLATSTRRKRPFSAGV